MQDVNQQAYDRGTSIFSPDGRLYQVEYAREAVKRGTSAIGVRTPEGVVLVVDKRVHSSLMERDSVEKLHAIDDHLGVATAGHVADGRRLVDYLRRDAQGNQLRYGERMDVETATKHITDLIQQYTQFGGARPFGVALLVAGVDADGTPRLFETDPSGTPYQWQAVAVGADRKAIQSFLEANYDPDASLDAGVDLALRALASTREEGMESTSVAVATVAVDSGQYRRLGDDEVAERVSALDPESGADEADEADEADKADEVEGANPDGDDLETDADDDDADGNEDAGDDADADDAGAGED